jgi:CRISPR system Cascade subunit CasC
VSRNYLTVHTLTSLPFHNVNRDDIGAPKQVTEGGVTRARISSQSIKREARTQFEAETGGVGSVRSRAIPGRVVAAAREITPDFDAEKLAERAKVAVLALTNNDAKKAAADEKTAKAQSAKLEQALATLSRDDLTAKQRKDAEAAREKAQTALDGIGEDKNPLVWLSDSEVTALAQLLLAGKDPKPAEWISAAFTDGNRVNTGRRSTDNLSIAMFGRMFAFAKHLQNEAAVAVSHATTTHQATVETDYFTTVDDVNPDGAGHLGQAQYTSGVYYRRVTFDRQQLLNTWSASDAVTARADLRLAVRKLIEAVPSGKNSTTAAQTLPSLILAEEQAHPVAYQFQTPVTAGEHGGFEETSARHLLDQARKARAYDADLFGVTYASGLDATAYGAELDAVGARTAGIANLVDGIVEWLLADD